MIELSGRLKTVGRRLSRHLPTVQEWLWARPRAVALAAGLIGILLFLGLAARRASRSGTPWLRVQRGDLTVRLTETGILRPAESITYRSPLGGREAEVTLLVPEGTLVKEGDLLARLDTTELKREMERVVPDLRQAKVNLQVAEAERQDSVANLDSQQEGEGVLGVDEARTNLRLAEKKVERLKDDNEKLKPLMEKGFITREELNRSSFELEQAEADLGLARRKAEILIQRTHPRDQQRARLQLAQKEAQLGNARARVAEQEAAVKALRDAIEACSVYARRPGLVVYEEFLGANPRRKIRVGDRVTGSQGLITIPEVKRMVVEASVGEFDVHRVRPGQSAAVRLDAYPGVQLTGKVQRVGTLARSSEGRPAEGKRFDLFVEIDPTDTELRPEMTARVDVVVGERKNVVLVPVNALFEHDGITVAYVLGTFSRDTRQVQLGDSNEVYAEVVAGLRESERVALLDLGEGEALRKPSAPRDQGVNILAGGANKARSAAPN